MKKFISLALFLMLIIVWSVPVAAFDGARRGAKVYGGNGNAVLSNVSRDYSNLTITIYGDTNFSSESNITFRAYAVGSTSNRKSNAISFYANDWYSGQSKTVNYINGLASNLDLRGTIPNQNSTAYAMFYGYVKL